MFVRVVEITAKTGKTNELVRIASSQVLTILRDQPGFVDEVILQSPDDAHKVLALSFWKSRKDADNYNRDAFPRVNQLINNLTEQPPTVRPFEVTSSTAHNIVAGKAA
jgi:heme-degrading monooxygenase HmoA